MNDLNWTLDDRRTKTAYVTFDLLMTKNTKIHKNIIKRKNKILNSSEHTYYRHLMPRPKSMKLLVVNIYHNIKPKVILKKLSYDHLMMKFIFRGFCFQLFHSISTQTKARMMTGSELIKCHSLDQNRHRHTKIGEIGQQQLQPHIHVY